MSRRFCSLFIIGGLWVGLLTGCGGGGDSAATGLGTPTAKEALTDLVSLLKHLDETKKKMPTKVSEIEPVEPLFPGAYLGLVRNDTVYVWGASLSPGSDAVLAYEKKAETDGGWVLLQDGTVKTMTADQFKAAPKAKK